MKEVKDKGADVVEKSILVELEKNIAIVYFNEPSTLNALSKNLKEELMLTLEELEKNDEVKVILFTGKGKAFCAGGDIKAMGMPYDPLDIKGGMDLSKRIIEKIRGIPKVTLAAVHGYAAGAGMSVALATDLVFAEEDTKFILSFKNVGLIPDLGLHHYLPQKIGQWKAKEWMWTGKTVFVEEAIQCGLVMEKVPKGKLMHRAIEFASELTNGPIDAYIISKSIVNSTSNLKIEDVMARENDLQTILRGTESHQQAVQSFFVKK